MEKIIKDYLDSQEKFLCEEWLYSKGIQVFEEQDNGKTYFRVKMGEGNSYKTIIISLQDILVFIYKSKN